MWNTYNTIKSFNIFVRNQSSTFLRLHYGISMRIWCFDLYLDKYLHDAGAVILNFIYKHAKLVADIEQIFTCFEKAREFSQSSEKS